MAEEYQTRNKKENLQCHTIRPVDMYSSEVWQLIQKQKKSLNAVEMDFWRRAARISRPEHIRNEEIRGQMKVERTLVDDIEKQQLI